MLLCRNDNSSQLSVINPESLEVENLCELDGKLSPKLQIRGGICKILKVVKFLIFIYLSILDLLSYVIDCVQQKSQNHFQKIVFIFIVSEKNMCLIYILTEEDLGQSAHQ